MGQSPSKGSGSQSGSPATALSGQGTDSSRMNRRRSIQALSSSKSTAAEPSSTKESATGECSAQRQHTPVQERLQSRRISETPAASAAAAARTAEKKPERRSSRRGHDTDTSRVMPTTTPSEAVKVPPPSSDRSRPPYYTTPSHLTRPPRLPLPIGDASTAPGSPILPTVSLSEAAAFDDSLTNDNTEHGDAIVDEDEIVDELEPYAGSSDVNKAVPTTIEWRGGGEKVFVTGSFVNWAKKFPLQKGDSPDGHFSTTLLLRPGTHHLKFIVDGTMKTADHLPTAVDFTNYLVNYIEVSADDIERTRRESDKQPKIIIPPDIYPPKVIPESLHIEAARQAEQENEEADKQEPEEEIPMGDFRDIIPQFLLDIDVDKEEESPAYQQAANIIGDYSTPPMLPLFLGRSILNGTTPLKDDNSVLNYPNHTVLNHLATSSIKNGVLATSVTTRYKRKYVTTILYKPTD